MTMGASVVGTVLSVVTFIVATKTLDVRSGQRFQEQTGEYLSRCGNNPASSVSSLRIGTAK